MTDDNRLPLTLSHVKPGELSTYEIAKQALALAATVDEVKDIHDAAERMKLYAKQAGDRDLIADAMALVMRSRRRLGEMLIIAKERGDLSRGGRPFSKEENREKALQSVTLKEAGIDKKLSAESQKLARFEEDDFESAIERGREKIKSGGAVVINPVNDLNTKEKQLHRDIREAQLAAKQKGLPAKQFGVVMADPEWPFDTWSEAGKDRSAENHYPTSALEIIQARPVETIAAEDCVLFLWVTAPHHAAGNGAMIMKAWGFTPKAEIIWDKVEVGTGFWFRNRHEILLVGTRGNVPAPAPGTQWPSIVSSPKGAHSEKPDWAYELVEDYFPNLAKIELNARRRRNGWDAWGYEAPDEDSSGGEDGSEAGIVTDTCLAADLVAADAETGDASSDVSSEGGEGAGVDPGTLPDPLTAEGQEAIIRAGYARRPPTPITELMAATGLSRDQIKKRAGKWKIANPENQRAAVRELMNKINDDRRAGA